MTTQVVQFQFRRHVPMLTVGALLLLFGPAAPHAGITGPPPCFVAECEGETVDFNSLPTGQVVDAVFGSGGSGPILVEGFNPALGAGLNAAVIFDSAAPTSQTGNDDDLGTPNETFGGPGEGAAGEAGQPFQNPNPQCKLLIIDEHLTDVLPGPPDGLVDLPDDADNANATLTFDFSSVGSVTLHALTLLDVEADETAPAMAELLDAANQPVGPVVHLPTTGNNGITRVDLGDVSGVVKLVVTLGGSGAIDDLCFTVDEDGCSGKIGDFVWLDENCNGLQDDGEPGLPGVVLLLSLNDGTPIGSTVTDADGFYLFEGLCAGGYYLKIRGHTLPDDLVPTLCNVAVEHDDTLDNDCSPVHVDLPEDDSCDLTVDFGYKRRIVGAGQGCTPGYWKQPHHFDSWPAPYAGDGEDATLFSDVFEDAFPGLTLAEVLAQGGGHLDALGRHVAAALLNAASDVEYGLTVPEVVDLFDAVHPQADPNGYEALKDLLEDLNEQGCPLD